MGEIWDVARGKASSGGWAAWGHRHFSQGSPNCPAGEKASASATQHYLSHGGTGWGLLSHPAATTPPLPRMEAGTQCPSSRADAQNSINSSSTSKLKKNKQQKLECRLF